MKGDLIIQLTHHVGQGSTGLGSVTMDLTRSLCEMGIRSEVWCVDSPRGIAWASAWSGLSSEKIHGFGKSLFGIPGLSFDMERFASSPASSDIALVQQHGIWSGVSRVTNILRRKKNIPVIVAPQGSLHRRALARSRWKKSIALSLYERENLEYASCLHGVGENEVKDFRDFGLRNPIAVIPNGVSPDWLKSAGDGDAFRSRFGIPPDKRILLFLSRVSPNKGLLMLLGVLAALGKDFDGWHLVIAGGDEFGHGAEVEETARQKGLTDAVTLVGPVFDQVKRDAFAAAALFVLPSFNEGAPIVVLEALGAGIPVLVTKASPWRELGIHRCGWWVNISHEGIEAGLREALGSTPEDLCAMGYRGKELVASAYAWSRCAEMNVKLYDWLLKRGERPDFVVTD